MRRTALALAHVAVLALVLGACASSKDTGLPAAPSSGPASKECSVIDMTDALKFVPEECTAKVGTKVTWKNVGGAPHTVTAADGKLFNSGADKPLQGGETFEFTFKAPGEVDYYCILHSPDKKTGMIGVIKVEA
jgi:plastocyanin